MSILVLQSSWWGRESWLLCLICLPDVSWWLSGSSSRCHGVVCSLWLWYFLIILIYYRIFKRLAKSLIRLRVAAGWSEPLLVAHTTSLEISCCRSYVVGAVLKRTVTLTRFFWLQNADFKLIGKKIIGVGLIVTILPWSLSIQCSQCKIPVWSGKKVCQADIQNNWQISKTGLAMYTNILV